ncbi:hypothetical protein Poli38472_004436 [Pythium oligandrum]|uniref:Cytochrome P450 n=1 Tax=Pythium oligandrum TaxID=41045 RepID=A0A8K1CBJ6_PYTOL|nr:hypothetical protein Poli38472_004436 [Pythium oligandrum]|eukprot:TMW59367.1 hypothetical protein Poli38472_004436 [Pythium oligandrum]
MKKNLHKVERVLDTKMKNHQQADLRHLFLGFTMQTFVEMGVGTELDWIGRDKPHPFEEAFDLGSLLSLRRIRVPEFVWKLERWLDVGQERALAKYCSTMRTWMNEVVQEGLKQATFKQKLTSSDTSDDVKSVVELFVEQSGEIDGLRPEDLVDFIMAFVVAARDTTALTLTWLFYELGRNPDIEQAIRKEMAGKLDVDKDTYLTPDHIRSLTMLEATIKETLRFHPVAPFFMREASEDTFFCGDILVKKGQTVGLSMYSINRNSKTWGPDAGEFKPQRWVDETTGSIRNIPPTQFFSFGAGPRMCVGMNLAMQQLRVVTANLLHKYRFDIDPSNDGTYVAGLTLNMKFPLLATVGRV